MPFYDMVCEGGHQNEVFCSYNDYDKKNFPMCNICQTRFNPCIAENIALYGLMRCRDEAFDDAKEATGEDIKSTKDIDRLEKAGVIRAVTNPSRSRAYKDKKYAEKRAEFKKRMR
jgi:hypothetical protein